MKINVKFKAKPMLKNSFPFLKELGTVTIEIGPFPKFDYILNVILVRQHYVGFRTVLFSSISLPVFLSVMVKYVSF